MPLVDANASRTASGNKVPEAIFFAALTATPMSPSPYGPLRWTGTYGFLEENEEAASGSTESAQALQRRYSSSNSNRRIRVVITECGTESTEDVDHEVSGGWAISNTRSMSSYCTARILTRRYIHCWRSS